MHRQVHPQPQRHEVARSHSGDRLSVRDRGPMHPNSFAYERVLRPARLRKKRQETRVQDRLRPERMYRQSNTSSNKVQQRF